MFIILTYQWSNPELFCYKFALNTNQGSCDFKSSLLNLPYSALTAGDTSGKPDQVTN